MDRCGVQDLPLTEIADFSMMSVEASASGYNGQSILWSQVDWSKQEKIVKNLRHRIFRAQKLGMTNQRNRVYKDF